MLIPLDVHSPEFSDVMRSALLQLAQDRDLWIRSIYPRLVAEASDEFKFRKESSAPSGFIGWRSGERLIESARRTLLAGAKSFAGPDRHFVNRHGRFANRYLDQVMMGQTSPGSYIVTAYAPPNVDIQVSSGHPANTLGEFGNASVRAVSQAVVRAVEATVEALDHYRSTGSLSGFESGVSRGISYEMANAILGIAEDSDGADISIEWDPAVPAPSALTSHFEFQGSDVEPLNKAAMKLAEGKTSSFVTLSGRVHQMAKKDAGGPGVFGIDAFQPAVVRKARVRLANREDYHDAVRAHDEDLAIRVSGRLEREGNLNWLYDASVVQVLGPLADYAPSSRIVEGQIELFADDSDHSTVEPVREIRKLPPVDLP
ncbi:hypothetical protein [Embleya sp. NPDC020630]|uniref:hypothetical protein n=1 Tax=Embleya sp. NPDC020630 TaxID=3363979 RepID=UPI003787E08C